MYAVRPESCCACVLVVAGPKKAAPQRQELPLRELRAEATVMRQFANVKLVYTFENTAGAAGSAKFYFPKDTGAALHALSATTQQGTVRAALLPRKEAQQTFDAAKKAGKTASLTTYELGDMYSLELANIAAGETFVVETEYATILPLQAGRFVLTLPSYIGPKYTSGPSQPLSFSAPNVSVFGAAAPGTAATGAAHQGVQADTRIAISVRVAGDAPAAITCTDANVTFGANSLAVQKRGSLQTDFRAHIHYDDALKAPCALWAPIVPGKTTAADASAAAQMDLDLPERGAATLLSMVPAFACAERPLALLILADLSGSMFNGSRQPTRAESAANAIAASLVNKLREGDHVGLTTFGSRFARTIGLQPLTDALFSTLKQDAKRLLGTSMGGTELFAAMHSALGDLAAYKASDVFQRCVVLLTDGDADSRRQEIVDEVRRAQIPVFCLGIGSGTSRDLLETIAAASGGDAFFAAESLGDTEGDLLIDAMNDLMRVARAPAVADGQIVGLGADGRPLATARFDRAVPPVQIAPAPQNTSFFEPGKAYEAAPFVAPSAGAVPGALAARVPLMRSGRVLTCALMTAAPVQAVRLTGTLYGQAIAMDIAVTAADRERFPGGALAALAGLALHRDWLAVADAKQRDFYAPWMLDVALRCRVFCSLVSFVTVHPPAPADAAKATGEPAGTLAPHDADEEDDADLLDFDLADDAEFRSAPTGIKYGGAATGAPPRGQTFALSYIERGARLSANNASAPAPQAKGASGSARKSSVQTMSGVTGGSSNHGATPKGMQIMYDGGAMPGARFCDTNDPRSAPTEDEAKVLRAQAARGVSSTYFTAAAASARAAACAPAPAARDEKKEEKKEAIKDEDDEDYGMDLFCTDAPARAAPKPEPGLRECVLRVIALQALSGKWVPHADLNFIAGLPAADGDVFATTQRVLAWLQSLTGAERALAAAAIEKAEAWMRGALAGGKH